jgi:hypothetical protein
VKKVIDTANKINKKNKKNTKPKNKKRRDMHGIGSTYQ